MAANNSSPAAILECFRLTGVEKTGKEIGRGSYANVIELRYRELTCAGKQLYTMPLPTDDLSKDQELTVLERFKKECDILSSVKHPNIVQFMGVYFEEGNPLPVLVMEFVPFTLSHHLEKHKTYPPEISYGILIDVAKALCYLHGGKPVIIHRDLSANNVLLTHDMSAKVSDLGTAKRLSEKLKQHQTRCPGTLVYMPPEAFQEGTSYNETLDCFSYGVLMLHIFCGEWPVAKDFTRAGEESETSRRQKFVEKMGSDHPLMSLVHSCLDAPGQRPSAKKILANLVEVQQKVCRPKTDKLSLLLQTNAGERDKLEQTIVQLRNEVQNMEDQHCAETNKNTNKIDELQNDIEILKSHMDVLKHDREVEQNRVEEKEEEIAVIRKKVEEEMRAYKKQMDGETSAKKLELNTYKKHLQEKERKLDDIIQRATERHKGVKSDERVSDCTQMHLLHHCATKIVWRKAPELPVGMTAPQCILINSSLYVGGGQTLHMDKEFRTTIFEFDTSGSNGRNWTTRFPKCPTMYFGLGELEGKLVVVGGQQEAEDKQLIISAKVFVLDQKNSWSEDIIPPMNIPRMRACVVSFKGRIAVCGGLEANSSRDCSLAVEMYRPESKEWCKITSLPAPRAALRATVIHNMLYLLGGFYPDLTGVSERDCLCIELENLFLDDTRAPRSWNVDIAKTPYHSSAPASICGSLLAIGGAQIQRTQTLTDAICAYSPVVNKWYQVDSLPIELSSATAITLSSGELVVLGGRVVEDRNVHVYIGSLE